MSDPVEVHVYDKAFAWQGMVGEFESLRATRRHLGLSTAEFTAPSDLDAREPLSTPGALAVVRYRGTNHVSGWVSEDAGTVLDNDAITYQITGFWDLLRMVLGWPVPGAALNAQAVAYWTMPDGPAPAETVVKTLAQANITRLGLPVTVATDQGRGSNIDPSLRFHPLTDRLFPALSGAGVGFTIDLVEGVGLVLDAYVPTTHTVPLTVASGVIAGGRWSRKRPAASHVVAGSQGEAESRVFFGPLVDTAREATYGFCGEAFIDARDTDDQATVTTRMQAALDDAGPRVSVALQLAETEDFTYPTVFHVGDVVPIELREDVFTTDVISDVEVSLTASDGLVVTPHVGDHSDDPFEPLLEAVDQVAVGVRDGKVR